MCQISGSATILANGQWEQADPAIHISQLLLDDTEARGLFEEKYQIGDWCDERQAYHAHLHQP